MINSVRKEQTREEVEYLRIVEDLAKCSQKDCLPGCLGVPVESAGVVPMHSATHTVTKSCTSIVMFTRCSMRTLTQTTLEGVGKGEKGMRESILILGRVGTSAPR